MKKLIFALLLVMFSGLAFSQEKPAKKSKKRDTTQTREKVERKLFAVKFYTIFKEEPNGDITALYPVKIGYYTIDKGGSFPVGGSINGVSLDDIKGHELLIDTVKGVVIYKGVYH
jgi:hypothetical protein